MASYCPELGEGNLRGACTSCAPLVSLLARDCFPDPNSPFPFLCQGDCSLLFTSEADLSSCEAPSCTSCWEGEEEACPSCSTDCFSYAHCFDLETGEIAPLPPPPPEPRVLSHCSDVRNAYSWHGCCSDEESFSLESDTPLYLRIV